MADLEDDDVIQVDDIAADIRNAAEEASNKTLGTKLASEDLAEKAETAASNRARDEHGKFVKAEQQVETSAPDKVTTDADRPSEQPQQQSNALTPPTSWSADAKTLWASIPAAVQQAAYKREQEMSEGQRQWSEQRQAVEQVIAPLHELSQQNGIPWQEGLNRLLNVEAGLRNTQTKAQTVAQLAKAYGVDLAALVNGSPQPQAPVQQVFDPSIIPQIVNHSIEQRFQALQQDQALNSEIQAFAGQRGTDGQPSHPHFETAKTLMGHLLQSGQASDMQDAYDKATWAMPEVRSQLQAAMQQPKVIATQQQAAKSKKAAVSVTGSPRGDVAKANGFDSKQSLDDDLREAFAMHGRQ